MNTQKKLVPREDSVAIHNLESKNNAQGELHQFLVGGGALFFISLLGYYYYTTYLRLEAKIWNHPLEYVNLPYINALDKMDSIITYIIPGVIIMALMTSRFMNRKYYTEEDHLSENHPGQYEYRSTNFYYYYVSIVVILVFMYFIMYIAIPKQAKLLFPLYLFSVVLLILWMLYVILKVDASLYKKFYRPEMQLKRCVNYYLLVFFIPVNLIFSMVLADYQEPTLLTIPCEKTLIKENSEVCNEQEYLYLVSENRGIGIWRGFSKDDDGTLKLSNQYFYIEMKNKNIEYQEFKKQNNE